MTDDDAAARRDKPWHFPLNRKLRHLQSISVRNLVVTPPSKPRGKTIDDEDVPNSLQSPSKVPIADVNQSLHPSRSFADLKSSATTNHRPGSHEQAAAIAVPLRQWHRRNTMPWNAPTPRARQTKLEEITSSRMADTWFSLHCDGIGEPVYVSEPVEHATNPSFRSFDLNMCGPSVSRRDHLTVKLWAKTRAMVDYVLLVELRLCLQSLQFLGKSLDSFHQPLPANSILFHFADGVYTNLTDLPPVVAAAPVHHPRAADGAAMSTSSYEALMKLANLDECIQDALTTRDRIESQINSILEREQSGVAAAGNVSQARDKLAHTKHSIATERKHLRNAAKRKEDLIASIRARREAMERGRETQAKARSHLPDAKLNLSSSARLLEQTMEDSKGQIRRIAEDLLAVYPIEPIPNKTLAFTIAGLHLPNSDFTDVDRDQVAAALGYTAHLVYLLSFYLSAPIPYAITPYLSRSFIQDAVSVALSQRTFPLHPANVQYRFEYGVFLLNKDIEFLLNVHGLRVIDIRHTLPNLKYLLYVLTAGTAEIPARKAGGIRGLLPGRLTPSISRRGSEDSVATRETVLSRSALTPVAKMNGGIVVDRNKPTIPSFADTASPVA
ncbi:putative UV radiation resistance protein (UVRAG) [Aspergillus homomorphus CBS 101889]|uniref:Autophagy-related protein 14 n=1 Tax=Aspergillus homomorphus (strain CBS 101889) TaxID=1450537 RepID=A0A395I8V7_ASPHC|nr:putative UV radiation resistance protein [Aspergillus homomorphus CBS 101889]RAL14574.1 putative UV radiation resistance protein [Aspergillus homomorphus CBS 101889]